jgi:LmbE family N-acetylglucosaminyl deacetylase
MDCVRSLLAPEGSEVNCMKNKTILVVAAHPDDEILGCGGTIVRHVRNGARCHILILGEGITSRDNQREAEFRIHEIKKLKKQAKKAAGIIGATSLETLSFPDNRMDSVDLLDVIKQVEKAVHKIRPDIIFTHHFGDLNIDHQITAKAVETAVRPLGKGKVKEVYAFEIPSSTDWSFSDPSNQFHPNCYFDIGDTLEIKLKAFKMYSGEKRTFPHPRSSENLIHHAKVRGSQSGLHVAEAFHLIRKIA